MAQNKWVTGVKCHPCKWSLEPAYLHLVMGPTSPLTQLQGEALHQHLQDSQASLSFCSAKEFFKKATWMCVDKSQGGNENKGSVVSPNRTMLKHQPQKQHNHEVLGAFFLYCWSTYVRVVFWDPRETAAKKAVFIKHFQTKGIRSFIGQGIRIIQHQLTLRIWEGNLSSDAFEVHRETLLWKKCGTHSPSMGGSFTILPPRPLEPACKYRALCKCFCVSDLNRHGLDEWLYIHSPKLI